MVALPERDIVSDPTVCPTVPLTVWSLVTVTETVAVAEALSLSERDIVEVVS